MDKEGVDTQVGTEIFSFEREGQGSPPPSTNDGLDCASVWGDDSPLEMFQEANPLKSLLENALYKQYQDNDSFKCLKGLEEFYYADYLNILKVLSQLPLASFELRENFWIYLQSFQNKIQCNLIKIRENAPNIQDELLLKKEMHTLLSIDENGDSPEIASEVCHLGVFLYHLTREQLLSSINLLERIDSKDEVKSLNTNLKYTHDAIQAWGLFLQQISSPLRARDSMHFLHLLKECKGVEFQLNQKTIAIVTQQVSEFSEITVSLYRDTKTDLSKIEHALEACQKALQSIQILVSNEENKQEEVVTEFYRKKEIFLKFCSRSLKEEKSKVPDPRNHSISYGEKSLRVAVLRQQFKARATGCYQEKDWNGQGELFAFFKKHFGESHVPSNDNCDTEHLRPRSLNSFR